MRNMWPIIKNEWQYLACTRVLGGIVVVFGALLLLAAVLGALQAQQQAEHYRTAQDHLRRQWESIKAMNPHGAAHYGTYVFKPANWLSGLDEGVNSVTGNVLRVEGHVQNEMVHSEASQMQAVSKFGKLKSALLLQYIIPILLVFLAFNTMSGEKQSGRLKMLLLQGATPRSIVLAKTLAVWCCGLLMLGLVLLVYGLMHLQNIDTDILARSLAFGLAYALFYLIISGLTVFLSARWQNATLALTAMLGIWIVWVIFVPNIYRSTVEQWHKLPSRNEFQAAMKEDRAKGIDGHNPSDEREKALQQEVLKKYGVDSLAQLPINFDGTLMQADEDYGNQVWDKHFGHIRQVLARQKQSLQWAAILNPFMALQSASMGFAASDNLHHQLFLLQVEQYRRSFIKMLNDKHAYGGSKTGDWDWAADNAFFKSVPDFRYQMASLGAVAQHYAPDMGLLLGWALLVLVLLAFGTQKLNVV